MKGALVVFLLLMAVTIVEAGDDEAAILRLHTQERQGHLSGNADLVVAALDDQLTVVENGDVHVMSRDEVRKTFVAYLHSVHYSVWEDLVPPVIHVAGDRRTAWAVIKIRAKYVDQDAKAEQNEFQSSWISIYEKRKGEWRMVAIASGCNPPCGLPDDKK